MTTSCSITIRNSVLESASRKARSRHSVPDQSYSPSLPHPSAQPVPVRSAFPLNISYAGGIYTCAITGPLDCETAPAFLAGADTLCLESGRRFAFDMSGVTRVDGDGFGALMRIQRRLSDSGGRLYLVACPDEVRSALAISRLEMILPHVASLRELSFARA
jgi:anti-anti-sigma factor